MCFYFLFLRGSVWGDSTFLRLCLPLLCCPFYWCIVAHCSVLSSFVFCSLGCSFFSISAFIDVGPLPFFLHVSGSTFIDFIYVFKEPAFSDNTSDRFYWLLLASRSFMSALIFRISFFLLSLGFVCSSFSSWFSCKVWWFILDFFFFLSPEVSLCH